MAKKNKSVEELLDEAIVKDDVPYEVPGNWVWSTMNIACDVRDGTHDSPQYINEGIPLITSKNLKNGRVSFENVNYISKEDHENIIKRSKVDEGDILFGMIGTIGNPVFVEYIQNEFSIKNVALFKPREVIENKFIYYYVQSLFYKMHLDEKAKGSTQKFIALGKLRESVVPIPPLKEQERIVERIESFFEKLDKSLELIQEARDGFKSRKDNILNEAFLGRLSSNINYKCRGKDTTEEIINEIRDELMNWYDNKVIDAKEKGIKKPRKLNFNIHKSELEYLLDKIPSHWRISYFEEIIAPVENAMKAGPFGSALKKSMYVPNGYKVYGQEQVIGGSINIGEYYVNEEKYKELESCKVSEGDLLISLVGTIGKTLIIPKEYKPGIINPRLVKISLNNKINKDYISRYFESPIAKYIMSEKSHGGTMEILNLDIIKKLPIPLPPLEEQKEIVRILDKLLEEEDKIEELTQLEEQIELIKKSILAKAFRGELGTNRVEEESAVELLREILSK